VGDTTAKVRQHTGNWTNTISDSNALYYSCCDLERLLRTQCVKRCFVGSNAIICPLQDKLYIGTRYCVSY